LFGDSIFAAMSVLLFTIIVLLGAFLAGLVGSLTGLGGGVIIIPLLTLVLGVDIHYAIGASIISVIATSSGSAAAYVKEGITNIRIGMFLEIATTISAIIGAVVTVYINPSYIAIIFGLILLFSAVMMIRKKIDHSDNDTSGRLAVFLKLNGTYPTENGMQNYAVHNVIGGFLMMFVAGIISGLLGIGSGALKVIAMDNIMRIPFKVSTTTSNFMMGVTAAASAIVYLHRGQIDPGIAMPVALGVLTGATVGSKILVKTKTDKLKIIFAVVVAFLALQMIYNGLTGRL
jgi:Predicted permeases